MRISELLSGALHLANYGSMAERQEVRVVYSFG